MRLHRYKQFVNENCTDDFSDINYQKIFIEKLTEKFPNGVKLYHMTPSSNVKSILEKGLLISNAGGVQVIHTVLGDKDVMRITSEPKGFTLLEISIDVDKYLMLIPEEATYYTDELFGDCENGDEEDNMYYKAYMSEHPDLVGGDITLYEDVPADWIKVIEVDGNPVQIQ